MYRAGLGVRAPGALCIEDVDVAERVHEAVT